MSDYILANGTVITKVSAATKEDVDLAYEAAHNAFETTWGLNAPGTKRAALLNKLALLMEERQDELAAIEALDNGATGASHWRSQSLLRTIYT